MNPEHWIEPGFDKVWQNSVPNMQLSKPLKVPILERYIDSDPEEPLSPEEQEERVRRTERIKNLLARSRYRWMCFNPAVWLYSDPERHKPFTDSICGLSTVSRTSSRLHCWTSLS